MNVTQTMGRNTHHMMRLSNNNSIGFSFNYIKQTYPHKMQLYIQYLDCQNKMDSKNNVNLAFSFTDTPQLEHVIVSEHSQAIKIVCTNQHKDHVITCGEDGQVHYYRLNNKLNQQGINKAPQKIGYCAVFDDPIISASWGRHFNSCYIALGSSQSQIAIIRVYPNNGVIVIQQKIKLQKKICCAEINWAKNKQAFLFGSNKQFYGQIFLKHQKWHKNITKNQLCSNISLAYHPINQDYFLMTDYNFICLLKIGKSTQQMNLKVHEIQRKQIKQKIIQILHTNEFPQQLNQLIMLTQSNIIIFSATSVKQIGKQQQVIQLRQKIDYMCWGEDQSQILCYSSDYKNSEPKILRDLLVKPKKLCLDLNGNWKWKNQGLQVQK